VVKETICCRAIDIVVVKGRDTPTVLYEIVTERNLASREQLTVESFSEQLISFLRSNDLLAVLNGIDQTMKVAGYEENKALQLLRERCLPYLTNGLRFTGIQAYSEKSF
jgi:hypothetical protein